MVHLTTIFYGAISSTILTTPPPPPYFFRLFLFDSTQLWKYRYFSAGLLLPHDPYPDHLKKLEEQISSGDAERKVLREVLADEVKVRRRSSRSNKARKSSLALLPDFDIHVCDHA